MLHPEQTFPGQVVLRVESEMPSLVVKSAVHTAARAGHEQVSFAVRPRAGER